MILVPARGVFPFEKVTCEREREVSFPFPSSVTKGSLCFQIVKEILKEFPFQVWKSSQRKGFFLSATSGVFPLCGNLNCCYTFRGLCNIYERVLIK